MLNKIHGMTFWSRHKLFYGITIILWLSSLVSIFIFQWARVICIYRLWAGLSFKAYALIVIVFSLSILVLDLILSSIFLKIYEHKKVTAILKGE